jgi:hypothetical protein
MQGEMASGRGVKHQKPDRSRREGGGGKKKKKKKKKEAR